MISLEGVDRVFEVGEHRVHALDGVSLTIENGEYVSIMGPSGSGKSTLLHILGLLDTPTSGVYTLDGSNVSELSDEQKAQTRGEKIGFVFQFFHLVPYLTAIENVELPLVLAGVAAAERRERVDECLAAMDIADRGHHQPEQLSGGQRQRVAIARAVVTRPSVLLADEPTGNLDRKAGAEVLEILESLRDDGITLIVVTHDPDIGGRADRRIRMIDGRIQGDEKAAAK